MTNTCFPSASDLLTLTRALSDHEVQYAVIGGVAMALHGFPRVTFDIDLLLPRDSENNQRLLRALESIPIFADTLAAIDPDRLNSGSPTSINAAIYVDLLYIAGEHTYEELRPHIHPIAIYDTTISTLDVPGMLRSKSTARAEDIRDRLKLQRLTDALMEARQSIF